MKTLRILQIGGGSMGTRRMRTLTDKEGVVMALLDARADRRERAASRFGIETFSNLAQALAWKPDALVISTPPDQHGPFVEVAREHHLHHFVEAGLRVEPAHVAAFSNGEQRVAAPSCTFHFMPIVQRLREVIPAAVGRLHSYQMFLSCNLPDWHPEERGQFYAYRPQTNAAREMVPFELYWLNELFGTPTRVSASILRRGSLPTEAHDTYLAQFQLENGAAGQLSVLMASPMRFRRGVAAGEFGIVAFDVLTGTIELLSADGRARETLETGSIESVTEAVYDAEITAFHDCLTAGEGTAWPHSYEEAAEVCATLAAMERSVDSGHWEPVIPDLQPEMAPA